MMTLTTKSGKPIPVPAGAFAAIVAEVESDESDIMTDYFATKTTRRVLIGWRFTKKESFAALRKAAAKYGPAKHLGTGRDEHHVFVRLLTDVKGGFAGGLAFKGCESPWHRDERKDFTTLAEVDAFLASAPAIPDLTVDGEVAKFEWAVRTESVEHRDNYSMGRGNYLKAGLRYSSGVVVRSVAWSTTVDAVALHVIDEAVSERKAA